MKRTAFVLTCIMTGIFAVAGILTWTSQPQSALFSFGAALMFGITLLALSRGTNLPLQMSAIVLNSIFLLASIALVDFGVNFGAGTNAYAIAAAYLAFLCTPSTINIIALRSQLKSPHVATVR